MTNSILGTIQSTIKANIFDDNAVFVFPTAVAGLSWAEWVVKNTDCKAVERERFLAWDYFKNNVEDGGNKKKNPIPSLLRKLFSVNLMEENAANPFLESVIAPKFASDSISFAPWISGILPKLGEWHTKITNADKSKPENSLEHDKENRDYKRIFDKYNAYLNEHNLFEPSWETKSLFEPSKKYFVFFPEIMDDYSDYEAFFDGEKRLPNIFAIHACDVSGENPNPDFDAEIKADFFSNAKTELRKTALHIRKLHEEEGVSWTDIALSAPDLDTYLPYIERELRLYCIPYVVRAGSSMTKGGAGSFFMDVLECYNNQFSFNSMRKLLLNRFVPWKDVGLNERLVRQGALRKCICSYNEGKDIWEESLSSINTGDTRQLELNLYKTVKSCVNAFGKAKSFAAVRRAWIECKRQLLDAEKFESDEEANNVFGRCLSTLEEFIKLENDFKISVSNPFKIWTEEIDDSTYQPQQTNDGVSVFKYKVSAAAFFPYQFVVDSNQRALSIQNNSLRFLTDQKRNALGIFDRDFATNAFINLYNKTNAIFSCAEASVSGFAITHSRLTVPKNEKGKKLVDVLDGFEKNDFITQEKDFLKGKSSDFPESVYELQFDGKNSYIDLQDGIPESLRLGDNVLEKVRKKYIDGDTQKVKIDASAMKTFYPCKRKWLFKYVLQPNKDSLSTTMFGPFDAGSIYHSVMENYFRKFQKNGELLPCVSEDGVLHNENEIKTEIADILRHTITNTGYNHFDFQDVESRSPLQINVLLSQVDSIAGFLIPVIRAFCEKPDEDESGKGGFGGFRVVAVEEWLPPKAGETLRWEATDNASYLLRGKIDLVLQNPATGNLYLIDYKKSSSPTPAQCIVKEADGRGEGDTVSEMGGANGMADERKVPDVLDGSAEEEAFNISDDSAGGNVPARADGTAGENLPELQAFQMSMYVTLLQKYKKPPIERAAYFSMKKQESACIVKNPKRNRDGSRAQNDKTVTIEEFEYTQKVFLRYAECYADEVLNGTDFKTDKKVRPFIDCIGCDYNAICRTCYAGK